jgi:hypothetical protein
VATMREALAKVIETGAGLPGLGADQIALLRRTLAHWEQGADSRPKPAKTTAKLSKQKTVRKSKRRSKTSSA